MNFCKFSIAVNRNSSCSWNICPYFCTSLWRVHSSSFKKHYKET
jgi:hypothetical protein